MTQIVSSISGIVIYAPSAAYAPTNSGDVSGIASSYQVVSATGTQLYAGTAYLTGVNSTPISAERAGQAANASMANSAYYDGTGRLISALPDSAAVSAIASSYQVVSSTSSASFWANELGDMTTGISGINNSSIYAPDAGMALSAMTARYDTNGRALYDMTTEADVSAIASAYAESAVSGKVDSSSMSSYALSADVSGVIDTVSANSATWGGGTGGVDSATVSAIASAYVESGVSGKLDASASSMFQPSGSYVDQSAFDDCCSAMSGYVSSLSAEMSAKQDVSGMSAYAETASVPVFTLVTFADPTPDPDPTPQGDCPRCGGTGIDWYGDTCEFCEGTGNYIDNGRVICGECGGTGHVDYGEGEKACHTCWGNGIQPDIPPDDPPDDPPVDPPDDDLCPTCGGSGMCSLCGGSGEIWSEDEQMNITCPNCGGSCMCADCGGTGHSGGGGAENMCPNCGGTGSCPTCGGTGQVWDDGQGCEVGCPECGGTGVCSNCCGVGTV